MKTFRLLAALVLAGVAGSASAQFVNSADNSRAASGVSARSVQTEGWNRIYVSYNKIGYSYDGDSNDYLDDMGLNGFQFGYIKGFSITPRFPLYVEAGIGLQYAFKNMDLGDYKSGEIPRILQDEDKKPQIGLGDNIEQTYKYSLLTLQVPVNLVYKYAFSDRFAIAPFVGIDLKYNLLGKLVLKNEAQNEAGEAKMEDNDIKDSYDANLFDKKDMGSKDATWKRFQIGWHIGLGMDISDFYASISYGTDFTEICKKTKLSNMVISLGYNF